MFRHLSTAIVALIFSSITFAQRDAKVPDPDPELERKTFQVTDGFEVTLYAADPLLAKPLQMNWDARGRLWVATSETYPQIKPGEKANDKIIILEDTKGVGKADKTTVFADGLLIPTGLEPGDGGVYVANSTELLHIEETKEGKAGKTRVMLSGFGTEDTHHILHTLRWGPDGRLYMNQSIYIHSHIETPYGPVRLNAGGILAYRPETQKLEIFARGWVNSWGHTFDKYGQSFATDGAGGEGINWVVPGGYYPTAIGPHSQRILHGLNPGHPKYCGAEIVSGRHLPDDWQGDIITNDFRGHRVVRFKLKEDGAGFVAIQMPDVIRSTHPAFRPIDVKMGPDGAIYIADWYNPIIQHGEVDFRDPRRDKTHGRIWRITAKGRPLVERPKLVGAPLKELFWHLTDKEEWTRRMTKRVLKERGEKEVLPELDEWIGRVNSRRNSVSPWLPEWDHDNLEVMWVYQSFDKPAVGFASMCLRNEDARVTTAAIRVFGEWIDRIPTSLYLFSESALHLHPRVRLEAVRALARIRDVKAAQAALKALDKPMDPWLDYALWLTMRELEPVWMPKLKAGEIPFADVKHLIFALKAVDAGQAVPTIVGLIKSGKVKKEQEVDLLVMLAGVGGPSELAVVFDRVLKDEVVPEARPVLLDALANASRQRKVKPTGDLGRLVEYSPRNDVQTRQAKFRLAGAWRLSSMHRTLVAYMQNETPEDYQLAAVDALAEFGGKESIEALVSAQELQSPRVRRAAVIALTGLDLDRAALIAADYIALHVAPDAVSEVVAAFVQRKDGASKLAKVLADKKLPEDVAKIALRVNRASGKESPELTAALMKSGRLNDLRRIPSADEMKEIIDGVRLFGDAARGEAVYRRKDMACMKCHSIAGAGGMAGPDLISIGASAQVDYIIDSLLQPNKQVKENFHSIRVETKKGLQVSGIKARETPTELILRDGEDREVIIAKDQIDTQEIGKSIMPEGLVDPLTRPELLDLVKFLSELGKVGGKFTVGAERVVRRWQMLEANQDAYTGAHRVGVHFASMNDPKLIWSPMYSTVAGVLPPDAAPRIEIRHGLEGSRELMSYLRFQVEVTTPGKVRLAFNGITGLSLWHDATAVAMKDMIDIEMKTGVNTFTLAADWTRRKDGIRVELQDAPGSAARARVVGGK